MKWDVAGSVASLGDRAHASSTILVHSSTEFDDALAAGDHVLIMSNGGFDGIHGKLLARLRERVDG